MLQFCCQHILNFVVLIFFSLSLSLALCIAGSLLAGSRSSSPGKLLGSAYGGLSGGASRVQPVPSSAEKRSKIPRSQGCSRETSPNRIGLGKNSHCSDTLTGVLDRGAFLLTRRLLTSYCYSSEFFSWQVSAIVFCGRNALIFQVEL